MANSIHVKEAIVINPSDPTPDCVLALSSLDSQLFLRFTIEYLLVFKPSQLPNNPLSTTSRLKSALSKILVPYYPLAGRVRSKADGSGLELVCRSQGAVFIEAVSDYSVNDFERAPRHVTQWRNLLSIYVADVLKGAPCLVIQLTWLKDNAATLAVGFNHCVCDGVGSANFLNSLAELATGRARLTDFKPVWDRHIFNSTGSSRSIITSHPEFNRVPDLCRFMTRFTNETLVPMSFIFSKSRLSQLKRLALSTARVNESTFTSFEVLSAHIWRSWTRSLNLPSNQLIKLLFSINIRDRVKPKVPSGYYGNAFVLGCAQTTVKDMTEKGLGYVANLIKRAKERVDNGHVKSVVEWVSGCRTSPDSVGVLIMSEWSRLGLERVDFGMGRPMHVGSVCTDRFCLILPVCNGDGIKVMVAVPMSCVDKYEYLVNNISS